MKCLPGHCLLKTYSLPGNIKMKTFMHNSMNNYQIKSVNTHLKTHQAQNNTALITRIKTLCFEAKISAISWKNCKFSWKDVMRD